MNKTSRHIHLCWFGPDPLPEAYRKNVVRWELLTAQTDWEVSLWTNTSADFIDLREMLSANGAHPVQTANIMRLAALYYYGGLYVDIDIIPLRLPEFSDIDCVNLFTETGKDNTPIVTNAAIYAPPESRHVLSMFWWCLQNLDFNPLRTIDDHLKAGAGMFGYFPADWFDGTIVRGVNHFSPVKWQQARVLNIAHQFTYDQWVDMAETFLSNGDVYGVHTYDSKWVYDLNHNRLEGTRNESDTGESESKSGGPAISCVAPGHAGDTSPDASA